VVLADISACPLSLNSGRCQSSEFIWRVLIFSVVFLTKLETLIRKNKTKKTNTKMKKKQPSTDDFELNGFHSGTVKRHNSHWTV